MRVAIPVRASAWFLVAAALPPLSGCAEDGGELPCVPYTSRCGEVEDTLEVCDPSGTGWSLAMLCTGGCQDGLCAGMIGPELGDKNPLWGRPPDNDFYNSDPEPPQAPGFDLPGVRVGLPEPGYKDIGETLGYPVGVVVSKGGVLQMDPGDWLEPKDGRCQRLIYKGPFFEIKDVGEYAIWGFFCMQHENWGPSELGFFSEPKHPNGTVQECQEDCGPSQSCIWSCELKQ